MAAGRNGERVKEGVWMSRVGEEKIPRQDWCRSMSQRERDE